MVQRNVQKVTAFIFENWPESIYPVDYKARQLRQEKIRLLKVERRYGDLTSAEKAKVMGISVGHYNYLKRKHKLTGGTK